MAARRVLIVGMGIAGMSAAISLAKAGWEPVVAEKSPARRVGGYFIGLFGTGKAATERLGVADSLHTRNVPRHLTWESDRVGNRFKGVGYLEQPGQPANVLRGDIEQALYDNMGDIEIRYDTLPISIVDRTDDVEVILSRSGVESTERFDLVIGADGARSWVRQNVVAPEGSGLVSLGSLMMCAFAMSSQAPGYADDEGINIAEPGRSLWIFPYGDRTPTALLSYRTSDIDAQFVDPPIETLRRAFGPEEFGPVLDHTFAELEEADQVLFDSANQVKIDSWHRGRVLVLGDAAWCVTLFSGMGASTAMGGAALLGDLLARHPDDLPRALGEWEQKLRPFVAYHQKNAHPYAQMITPSNRVVLAGRNALMRLGGARPQKPGKRNPDGSYKDRATQMRNLDLASL